MDETIKSCASNSGHFSASNPDYPLNFIPVTNLIHKFLYSYNVTVLCMFRAVLCSSSGAQIVCIRHVVSSLSMSGRGGRTVHSFLSQPVYCTTTTATH